MLRIENDVQQLVNSLACLIGCDERGNSGEHEIKVLECSANFLGEPYSMAHSKSIRQFFYNTVCGSLEQNRCQISREERKEIMPKRNSRAMLNLIALLATL